MLYNNATNLYNNDTGISFYNDEGNNNNQQYSYQNVMNHGIALLSVLQKKQWCDVYDNDNDDNECNKNNKTDSLIPQLFVVKQLISLDSNNNNDDNTVTTEDSMIQETSTDYDNNIEGDNR